VTPLRDIKRRARRDVHAHASIAALYLPPAAGSDPVPCTVRLLLKTVALENGAPGGAERQQSVPKILFLREQLPVGHPQRNAKVSVAPGEAYLLGIVEPTDDITVSAAVTTLSAAQTAGLPVPEGA
jgi:hypothetical protein